MSEYLLSLSILKSVKRDLYYMLELINLILKEQEREREREREQEKRERMRKSREFGINTNSFLFRLKLFPHTNIFSDSETQLLSFGLSDLANVTDILIN